MSVCRLLPFVALLLFAPLVRAGDAHHGSAADLPDQEFAILAAQWGTGSRFADVTPKARALATSEGLDVQVERSHFGDPFPHYRKSLVVFYLWRGKLCSATAPEHGRLRIPPEEADAGRARRAWIADCLEGKQAAALRRLDKAVSSGSSDKIRKAVQKNHRAARAFARRYVVDLGDDGAALALRIVRWKQQARRQAKGLREAEIAVASSSDWLDLRIDVKAGDIVAIQAEGEWKLGTYAGSCDATGRSGDRYRVHSTVGELRHGCLLVRSGDDLFVAGTPGGAVRVAKDADRIEAKCNDDTYRDNSGAITLRVLVVPGHRGPAARS